MKTISQPNIGGRVLRRTVNVSNIGARALRQYLAAANNTKGDVVMLYKGGKRFVSGVVKKI